MGSVARERFVPEGLAAIAYSDRAVPLARGRSLMPPAALGAADPGARPDAGREHARGRRGHGLFVRDPRRDGRQGRRRSNAIPRWPRPRAPTAVEAVEGPLEAGHQAGAPFDLILIDGAVEERFPKRSSPSCAMADGSPPASIENGVGRLAVGTRVGKALRPAHLRRRRGVRSCPASPACVRSLSDGGDEPASPLRFGAASPRPCSPGRRAPRRCAMPWSRPIAPTRRWPASARA